MGQSLLSFGSHHETSVGGVVLDTGIEFGTGVVLGEIYSRYPDKPWAQSAPYAVGGVGKLGAVACTLLGGPEWASAILNRLGGVGVAFTGLHLGLWHGRKASGVKTITVPASTDTSKITGSRPVALGELPPAQPGRGMNWDLVQEMATMH